MFHVVSPSGSEGGKHHMNESWTLNPNIHHILNYGRAIFNHHQNLWDQLHIPVYVNALIIKTCIYWYYFGKRVSVVISLFAHHLEKKTNNSWKLLNVSEVCSRKCSVFEVDILFKFIAGRLHVQVEQEQMLYSCEKTPPALCAPPPKKVK